MAHCEYPCPCGYAGDLEKECSCRAPTGRGMVAKYQNRISGPILDRIDIHLEVPRVPIAKPASLSSGEPSSAIRVRVAAARARQAERFAALGKPSVLINADMGPAEVQAFCKLDEAGRQLLRTAAAQLNLSARAYHRVYREDGSPGVNPRFTVSNSNQVSSGVDFEPFLAGAMGCLHIQC